MTVDGIQLTLALVALPITLVFIVRFGQPNERWWRSWFGVSLMMIAVAVFSAELTVVLYRIFGPEYWGRDVLRVSSQVLTVAAMGIRTKVLISAQRQDRLRGRGPHRMR